MMALASIVAMFALLLASPFVYGYAMHWFHLPEAAGVALLTAWMYSVLHWGTVYHAKHVMKLFERIENATKN